MGVACFLIEIHWKQEKLQLAMHNARQGNKDCRIIAGHCILRKVLSSTQKSHDECRCFPRSQTEQVLYIQQIQGRNNSDSANLPSQVESWPKIHVAETWDMAQVPPQLAALGWSWRNPQSEPKTTPARRRVPRRKKVRSSSCWGASRVQAVALALLYQLQGRPKHCYRSKKNHGVNIGIHGVNK